MGLSLVERFEEQLLDSLRRRMPSGIWSLERVIIWDGWELTYKGPSHTVSTQLSNFSDNVDELGLVAAVEWCSAQAIQEIRALYDAKLKPKGARAC